MCKANSKSFNTNERGINYLLNNDKFQIDDHYWRMHVDMVFTLMTEQGVLEKDGKVFIQVDFTSQEDDFLILCASIVVHNCSVPLYFSMRNYPRKKGQYDHKKMEVAFLKALKHILSKKYQYVIVADRGFGNDRFMQACSDCGFEYVIRIQPNMRVECDQSTGMVHEVLTVDGTHFVKVIAWDKEIGLHRHSSETGSWYLASNSITLTHTKSLHIYKDRFKIEKCFQDLKSAGFDMESSKIKKYSHYKRLLAIVMVAHALLVLLGHVIVTRMPSFLKGSAEMADVTLAYFQLGGRHAFYFQKNN